MKSIIKKIADYLDEENVLPYDNNILYVLKLIDKKRVENITDKEIKEYVKLSKKMLMYYFK